MFTGTRCFSRRDFLKTASAIPFFLILPARLLSGVAAPGNQLARARVGSGGGMKIPQAHRFQIAFASGALAVSQVVAGDNAPYAQYIEARNLAARMRGHVSRS